MTRLRVAAVLLIGVAVHACAKGDTDGAATDSAAALAASAAVQPAAVSAEQFASLGWLIGDWRGSGGQYPAFFESYRMLNDSTIQMKSWADSTFAVATDSSEIAWRAGTVQSSGDGKVQNVLARMSGDSLHFSKVTGQGGDFVWAKETSDRWVAVLGPARAGDEPTVYRMTRVRP